MIYNRDIEAEMTPVRVRSTRGYTRQMMLRLDEDLDTALEEEARERDNGSKSDYVRNEKSTPRNIPNCRVMN